MSGDPFKVGATTTETAEPEIPCDICEGPTVLANMNGWFTDTTSDEPIELLICDDCLHNHEEMDYAQVTEIFQKRLAEKK
jgi:hypothetical protein